MKIDGTKILLETGDKFTGCGYTFEVVKSEAQPTVEQPVVEQPIAGPQPASGRLSLNELIDRFNSVLISRGYNAITPNLSVYAYLRWANGFTEGQYDGNEWMFRPETYPLVYDYRGKDTTDDGTAYNALQAWLMASILAELVPDAGASTNTQTELFKKAYEIGGGRSYPLYNGKAFKADPYAMREAASVMYAICRGDSNIEKGIATYRAELGGKPINASSWDGLGYKNTMLTDTQGRRGYRMDYLGYCVNSTLFLPTSPGPRIPTTTVCEQPQPWEQGQDISLFNQSTGNYLMDEKINSYFVQNYNMMSRTPLSVWNSYPLEKQNKMVNVGAIPPCTFIYMFGKKKVKFDGIINKSYDGKITANYYCFSETGENTGLALDGPFSDLQGVYRYNTMGDRERFLTEVASVFDDFRFPTEDPNYGRCRPGCKVSRTVESLNPTSGAAENEIYNVDLCVMVADDVAGTEKGKVQDGFAADSPRSYVSGHSAQVWGLALMLTQLDNEGNCENWVKKAYEYSVCRSIGRFHWNSDCVYGRLFGAMALPIINAMSGMKNGMDAIRNYMNNPAPVPEGDWKADIVIKNLTGSPIQSTGEIRLYISPGGDRVGINTYLPNWVQVGAAYTFGVGETDFCDMGIHCEVNGGYPMLDEYNGMPIVEERFYDQRHWNSGDCGWKVSLDTSDPRCSSSLRKSGGTYVLKVENK